MIRSALTLLGLLAATTPATAAEAGKPKLLAFVVGIERYADPELDNLIYAADDARAVYAQLGVIADLDPASVLLVADDEATAEEERTVTAQQLRDALETFVPKIKDRANVIVYLGGHGTLSPKDRLRYLPTDYDPNTPSRFVPFDDIIRDFREWIEGKGLDQTNVTFLVNMCGAGNAGAMAAENPKLINISRQMWLDGRFGFRRYAILPATPKNRNAYERKEFGGSEFAHSLLAGLSGPAADKDGVVTVRALFDHLNNQLGGDLPWSDDYSGDIVLGRTGAMEGEAHYLLGMGLLAGAQGIGQIQRDIARDADRAAEQKAQAGVLYDLARDQLSRVEGRNPDLTPRASLRLAQVATIAGGTVDAPQLEQLAESNKLDDRERGEAKILAMSEPEQTFSTFKSFRNYLESGVKLYVVIINSTYQTGSSYNEFAFLEDDSDLWATTMKAFPGFTQITQLTVNLHGMDETLKAPEELIETIKQWRVAASQPSSHPTHLIVLYTGQSYVKSLSVPQEKSSDVINKYCLESNIDMSCRLQPIDQELISQLAELWQAPMTFIYDAPYGGFLLERPPVTSQAVALLVAARERNGMTFVSRSSESRSSESTSKMLASAFSEGADDLASFEPLTDFQQRMRSASPTWYVPGTAAWLPHWGARVAASVAVGHLAPLDRFALQVGAGCAERAFAECDGNPGIGPGEDGKDVFVQLADAADHDLARHALQAADAYGRVAAALSVSPMQANDVPSGPSGGRLVKDTRNLALGIVNRRAVGALSKEGRRVVILQVGIEDYASPLVADLPHVASDLAAYGDVLRGILEGSSGEASSTIVHMLPTTDDDVCAADRGNRQGGVLQPKTATELLDCLRMVSAELRPQDLLLLIFSGRGVEIDGRRYLAMAGAEPALGAAAQARRVFGSDGPSITWDVETSLVDLEDLAAAATGHWFVGIYDTQFTPPVLDLTRGDQILDKHLDSVRPRSSRAVEARAEEAPSLHTVIRSIAQPRGDLPPRQVHVWLEGRLTQQAAIPNQCVLPEGDAPAVASPIAAAILGTMPAQNAGTYRDWLRVLADHTCLRRADEAIVVFQGDLDVPLLASGEGAEFVDYFHNGAARYDFNMRVAQELAKDVVARFPTARNKLAWSALLVTLAQLHGEDAELHGFLSTRTEWLTTAIELLERMTLVQFQQDFVSETEGKMALGLWAIRVELLSRAYTLRDRTDEAALLVLRAAEPTAVLGQRGLGQRLVNLSGEFLRRDPGVVLSFAREKLQKLGAQGGAAASAMAELTALIRAERARRTEPYQITLPESGSTGSTW